MYTAVIEHRFSGETRVSLLKPGKPFKVISIGEFISEMFICDGVDKEFTVKVIHEKKQ